MNKFSIFYHIYFLCLTIIILTLSGVLLSLYNEISWEDDSLLYNWKKEIIMDLKPTNPDLISPPRYSDNFFSFRNPGTKVKIVFKFEFSNFNLSIKTYYINYFFFRVVVIAIQEI